jgi:biotin operon repressor
VNRNHLALWGKLVMLAKDLTQTPAEVLISQERLAQHLGVTSQSVAKWMKEMELLGAVAQMKVPSYFSLPKTTYLFYEPREEGNENPVFMDRRPVVYTPDPYVRHDGEYKTKVKRADFHPRTEELLSMLESAFAHCDKFFEKTNYRDGRAEIRSAMQDAIEQAGSFDRLFKLISFISRSDSEGARAIRADIEHNAVFLGAYIHTRVARWLDAHRGDMVMPLAYPDELGEEGFWAI